MAHEPEAFSLADHRAALREMGGLGNEFSAFITYVAQRLVMDQVIDRLKDLKIEIPGEEPKRALKCVNETIEHFEATPPARVALQEKALRMKLALAVGFICVLIVAHRDQSPSSPAPQ